MNADPGRSLVISQQGLSVTSWWVCPQQGSVTALFARLKPSPPRARSVQIRRGPSRLLGCVFGSGSYSLMDKTLTSRTPFQIQPACLWQAEDLG